MKQETTKKDKSATDSVPAGVTDISTIEDILRLLKVLYGISTNSAYDFGEGGMCWCSNQDSFCSGKVFMSWNCSLKIVIDKNDSKT